MSPSYNPLKLPSEIQSVNTSNYPSSVPYYISSVVLSSSPSVVPSTFLSVKSSLVLSLLSISSQYNGPSEAPSIKLSNLLFVVPPIEPYNNHISVLLNAPSSSMSKDPSCVPNFSHSGDLVFHPHFYQAQEYLHIQVKMLTTNHQPCHLHYNKRIILVVISLLHHMYQVGILQELQVFLQAFYQTQVQLLIQVKLVATNPQTCHLQSHQWNIITILDLKHHMYQVGVHT